MLALICGAPGHGVGADAGARASRSGSARELRVELAAGRLDLAAARVAHRDRRRPPSRSRRTKRSIPAAGVPLQREPGVGLSGIRFTCVSQPRASVGQAVGLLVGVVHAVDHHVLEAHPAAGARRRTGGRRRRPRAIGHLRLIGTSSSRSASVDCMQADGQVDLRQLVDHAVHARHDARGAER